MQGRPARNPDETPAMRRVRITTKTVPPKELFRDIAIEKWKHVCAVPVGFDARRKLYIVAVATEPLDHASAFMLDDVTFVTGLRTEPVLASRASILRLLDSVDEGGLS